MSLHLDAYSSSRKLQHMANSPSTLFQSPELKHDWVTFYFLYYVKYINRNQKRIKIRSRFQNIFQGLMQSWKQWKRTLHLPYYIDLCSQKVREHVNAVDISTGEKLHVKLNLLPSHSSSFISRVQLKIQWWCSYSWAILLVRGGWEYPV